MFLLWILAFSLLGSVGAIAGAALLLVLPAVVREQLVPYLISYATGTLLGAAFLGTIPAGLEEAPAGSCGLRFRLSCPVDRTPAALERSPWGAEGG